MAPTSLMSNTLTRPSTDLRIASLGCPAGAVVVGGDYQGLAIVRSLGRRGIPVFVVDDAQSLSRFSKYVTRFLRVAELRDERKTVDVLLNIGKRFGLQGWVLYPTRDETVAAISRHRAELAKMFRVPTPEWSSVQWAWDKRNTYKLAQDLGIPTPGTYYPTHVDQLSELSHLAPPFAIKPAIKEHFVYATKAKAWRADTHAELTTLFRKASELLPAGEIMVQEVIPGGGSQQFSYCAFFRDGLPAGKMTVCRRRQHPLQFGRASTYVETVDLPILEEYSEKFLRTIGYYGLVEVEYKLDPRDSKYKLLDVNARTWGYHSLGAREGLDFSYMLYSDQTGLPVAARQVGAGLAWVRMTTDLPTACLAMRCGEVNLKRYLRSLRACTTDAVFSTEDPLPGLAEIVTLPYQACKKGF